MVAQGLFDIQASDQHSGVGSRRGYRLWSIKDIDVEIGYLDVQFFLLLSSDLVTLLLCIRLSTTADLAQVMGRRMRTVTNKIKVISSCSSYEGTNVSDSENANL